jgi:hypothetical protein
MDRTNVRSSTIRSIGYDESTSVLEVEFLSGGLYQYLSVPRSVYDAFMAASSKGRYLDQHIKNRYRTVRIRK